MQRHIIKPKPLWAWMQPGSSKTQQVLSVVLVPLQPGVPFSLKTQIEHQLAGKLSRLLTKALEVEPGARGDLTSRLNSLGLLPYEATDPDLTQRELVTQLTEGNPELRSWLQIETKGETEPKEIHGARQLYESLTMYQWLEALESRVEGRS